MDCHVQVLWGLFQECYFTKMHLHSHCMEETHPEKYLSTGKIVSQNNPPKPQRTPSHHPPKTKEHLRSLKDGVFKSYRKLSSKSHPGAFLIEVRCQLCETYMLLLENNFKI